MITRLAILLTLAFTSLSFAAAPVLAQANVVDQCDDPGVSNSPICQNIRGSTSLFGQNSLFEGLLQLLIFVIGAIALIMIVVGGLKYVLSGGDSNATQSAKNTILYAVIGLVIAIIAQGLLTFVLNRII